MDNSNFLEKLYNKVSKTLIDNNIIVNNISEEYPLRISYFDQLLFSTVFYSMISKNNNSIFVRIPLLIPKYSIVDNSRLDNIHFKNEDEINSIPLFKLDVCENSYQKNKSLDEIKDLLNVVSSFFNGSSLYDYLMSYDNFNNNLENLPTQNLSDLKNLNFQEIVDVFSLFTNDQHRLVIVHLHKNNISNDLFNDKYVEIELEKCEKLLNLCLEKIYDEKEFHVLINEYFEKVKKIKLLLDEINNNESRSFFKSMHKVNATASSTYRYNPYSRIGGKPLFNNIQLDKTPSNNIFPDLLKEEVKYVDDDLKAISGIKDMIISNKNFTTTNSSTITFNEYFNTRADELKEVKRKSRLFNAK
jgi:hypothetical protein